MRETNLDWIFQGPACAVLVINLIFLFRIMWVSVIKMIERTLKHLLSNYYYNDDVLPKTRIQNHCYGFRSSSQNSVQRILLKRDNIAKHPKLCWC